MWFSPAACRANRLNLDGTSLPLAASTMLSLSGGKCVNKNEKYSPPPRLDFDLRRRARDSTIREKVGDYVGWSLSFGILPIISNFTRQIMRMLQVSSQSSETSYEISRIGEAFASITFLGLISLLAFKI